MSLDLKLISRIVADKSFLDVQEQGISARDFESAERNIFKFLEEHWKNFGDVASKDVIEERFGLTLPQPTDSLEFWVEEVKQRSLQRDIAELSVQIDSKLRDSEPKEALEILAQFVKKAQQSSKNSIKAVGDLIDDVKQSYFDAKAGKTGIKTPFPTMDNWTLGWWPGDVSFISARLGVGKTWCAVLCSLIARKNGHKVLFVSGEMSKKDVVSRYAAIDAKMPYGGVRRGQLGQFLETNYLTYLDTLVNDQDFTIMDGTDGFRSADVEAAIARSDAELVVVDACYRIKANFKVKDRFENMAVVADDLKAFAVKYNKAIVATTQMNRESTKKKSYGDEDIALSDVVGWVATNIFALRQEEEQKANKIMAIHPLKVREGENGGDPLIVNWDFMSMNFGEIDKAQAQAMSGFNDDTDDF